MNTICKVHVTKKEEEEVLYINQKKGLSYLRQIGKNVQCAQNLVTVCESKNMMEFAVCRSDYGSIHYCNGHYSNECYTVTETNACNSASFITVMPLW